MESPWSALNSQTPQQSQSSQSVIENIGLSPSEGMHIHSNERNPVDHNICVLGGFQPRTSEAGVSTVWGAPRWGSPLARLRPSDGMGQDMPQVLRLLHLVIQLAVQSPLVLALGQESLIIYLLLFQGIPRIGHKTRTLQPLPPPGLSHQPS